MSRLCLLAVLAAGLLTACHQAPVRSPQEIASIVAAADWERVADVRIELRDSGFAPRELKLKVGQPYRLTVVNQGVNNHYFNAPEFFATIAARKAEVPRYAEVKATHFSTFEVFASGGTFQLWFVPLEKGRYRAHCHLGNHAEMGVEGLLIVE